MSKEHQATLLYDGACGLCSRTAALVRSLDCRGHVWLLDVASDWLNVERRYPFLRRDDCLSEIHLVAPDGRVTAGFDAFRALLRVLPLTWPLLPLLYVPGARAVGRRVYRAMARHRARVECPVDWR